MLQYDMTISPAAIKARDHQREECIAQISFLLSGALREALEDTSPTKHADFVKLQAYYITKVAIEKFVVL